MKKLIVWLLVLFATPTFALTPEQIVNRVKSNYLQVKDFSADIVLDYHVHLLGCGGTISWPGKMSYKAPDLIKFEFTGRDTYWLKGNRIRKQDQKGRRFYITLINAADMSVGFHPGLMSHNFNLKLLAETPEEYLLEGLPKPGILKNAKKLVFHIDKERWLLRSFDIFFPNSKLNGTLTIDYELIEGLWTPVRLRGQSAIEVGRGLLVGLGIDLKSRGQKINQNLPSGLFDPGF